MTLICTTRDQGEIDLGIGIPAAHVLEAAILGHVPCIRPCAPSVVPLARSPFGLQEVDPYIVVNILKVAKTEIRHDLIAEILIDQDLKTDVDQLEVVKIVVESTVRFWGNLKILI